MTQERFWRGALYAVAALLVAVGLWWAAYSPLVGLAALILALWPLALAHVSLASGGCLFYPLMIVPIWVAFPLLGFVSALATSIGEESGNGATEAAATAAASYFFFVTASTMLALRHRFSKAEDRYSVSLGEKVTVSLFALAPLFIIGGFCVWIAGEWLWDLLRTGR